jgi:hypothetical protein
MDYKFLFFCFLSVVLITGGGFYFFTIRQEITSAIYFTGAIVASIYFGFRWFNSSGNISGADAGQWPPVINYCPDFLTLATIEGEQVCIDTVGVAQAGGMATSDGTQIADQYIFHLFLHQVSGDRVKSLCDQAKAKQVTWEGVWNGSSCMNREPPKPPTSSKA